MASLKDLIVMGPARFLDKLYGNLEGNANTATKLISSDGSTDLPVYFSDGQPVAISNLHLGATNSNTYKDFQINRKSAEDTSYGKLFMCVTDTGLSAQLGYQHFNTSGTKDKDISIYFNESQFKPSADNTVALGASSSKWSTVYATTFNGDLNGNATTATALASSAGSSVTPVYFSNGKPVAVGSIWTNSTTSSDKEFDVGVRSAAGTFYMYSTGSSTGNRGLYGANNEGTPKSILVIDSNNNVTLNGNASTATTLSSTLGVDKGGTGAANKLNAKFNLGISYGTSLPTSGMSEGDIFFKIG